MEGGRGGSNRVIHLKEFSADVIVSNYPLEVSTGHGEVDSVVQVQVLDNIGDNLPWQATDGHDAGCFAESAREEWWNAAEGGIGLRRAQVF
jgi:hypothetical protein